MTPDSLKSRLVEELGDVDDVTESMLLAWCNREQQQIYRYLVGNEPERYVSEQTYTSPSGSTALPTDYANSRQRDCGFFIVDSQGNVGDKLVQVPYGTQTTGFYLKGDFVVFTGSFGDYSVILRYIPDLALLTDIDDVMIIPDDFEELAVAGLIVRYYKANEDPRLNDASQDYKGLLSEFFDTYRRTSTAVGLAQSNAY